MSHIAPRARAPCLLASAVVVLAAALSAGCDKAKEEPVAKVAAVIMPSGPAPSDSNSSSSTSVAIRTSTSTEAARSPPVGNDIAPGIKAGNGGSLTGGTVSVISNPPAPVVAATPPTTTTPASPLDPSVLPPALVASRTAGAGAIGASASAPADDQPRSVPPGSKS